MSQSLETSSASPPTQTLVFFQLMPPLVKDPSGGKPFVFTQEVGCIMQESFLLCVVCKMHHERAPAHGRCMLLPKCWERL